MEETISGTTAEFVRRYFRQRPRRAGPESRRSAAGCWQTSPGRWTSTSKAQPGLPEMAVRLRPERLLQYGFRPVDVLDAIQTAYQGTAVSQIYDGNRVFDVAVILDGEGPRAIRKPSARCSCATRRASIVPLRELADIQLEQWPLQRDARRRATAAASHLQRARARCGVALPPR